MHSFGTEIDAQAQEKVLLMRPIVPPPLSKKSISSRARKAMITAKLKLEVRQKLKDILNISKYYELFKKFSHVKLGIGKGSILASSRCSLPCLCDKKNKVNHNLKMVYQ